MCGCRTGLTNETVERELEVRELQACVGHGPDAPGQPKRSCQRLHHQERLLSSYPCLLAGGLSTGAGLVGAERKGYKPQSAGNESVDCADLGGWSASGGGRGCGETCLKGKRSGLGVVKGAREEKDSKRAIKDNKQIYVVQVRAGRKEGAGGALDGRAGGRRESAESCLHARRRAPWVFLPQITAHSQPPLLPGFAPALGRLISLACLIRAVHRGIAGNAARRPRPT